MYILTSTVPAYIEKPKYFSTTLPIHICINKYILICTHVLRHICTHSPHGFLVLLTAHAILLSFLTLFPHPSPPSSLPSRIMKKH